MTKKTYSNEELVAKAKEIFESHPKSDKLFATTDGQFFLAESPAKNHAKTFNSEPVEISRPSKKAKKEEVEEEVDEETPVVKKSSKKEKPAE